MSYLGLGGNCNKKGGRNISCAASVVAGKYIWFLQPLWCNCATRRIVRVAHKQHFILSRCRDTQTLKMKIKSLEEEKERLAEKVERAKAQVCIPWLKCCEPGISHQLLETASC